jgi:hypothetical protein
MLDPILIKMLLSLIGGLLMGFTMGYSYAMTEVFGNPDGPDRECEDTGSVRETE